MFAFIAAPRMDGAIERVLRAAATLGLTAYALLLLLYRAQPESKPEDRAGWGVWMRHLLTLETSCKQPLGAPPPPLPG